MKKAKLKNVEKKEELITEEYSVKNFIKIVVALVIVFGLFYFITTLTAKTPKVEEPSEPVVVDTTQIPLSNLLTRSAKEYYVLAIKESLYKGTINYSKVNYTEQYNKYIKDYQQKDNSLKFYTVDLDNVINKKYASDKTNITEDLSKLKVSSEVLFKISDGKIDKFYVGHEDILAALSKL